MDFMKSILQDLTNPFKYSENIKSWNKMFQNDWPMQQSLLLNLPQFLLLKLTDLSGLPKAWAQISWRGYWTDANVGRDGV